MQQSGSSDVLPYVGSTIHGYRLNKLIDDTKNSTIFSSDSETTPEQVCLKFIKCNDDNIDRVEREAKLMEILNSPFIMKAKESFDYGNFKCIVMPLAESDILETCKKAQGHKLPECIVKNIALRLLNALKYLHANHICHRDIKPDNFFLLSNDDVQLGDLGFAMEFKNGELCKEYMGTLDYAAPEVIKGIPYDESVDIWSLGVSLFTLLCGHGPFPRSPEVTLRRCIQKGSYFFASHQWAGISEEAKDLIKHMIQVDPVKRWTPEECLNHKWFTSSPPRFPRYKCNTL